MIKNIILIVIDSLRFDHINNTKQKSILTPHLANLSKESLVFNNAISQGPTTRVSVSAFMSSTYGLMYGGQHKLSPERPVIQAHLKTHGFYTIGINANLYLSKKFGWNRGFDHYDDCNPGQTYARSLRLRMLNQIMKRVGNPLVWPVTLPAETLFERARCKINRSPKPFFCWIHLMDGHWPYHLQRFSWDKDWQTEQRKANKLRSNVLDYPDAITDVEHKMILSQYKNAVLYTDSCIGKFIEWLRVKGFLESTMIIITSDHGEEFLDHGEYYHHPKLFDELIHVPLIIYLPEEVGFKPGIRIDHQVRLIDLVPTIYDIFGIPLPEQKIFGNSLINVTQQPIDDRIAISESPGGIVWSVRTIDRKFIYCKNENQTQLYNLNIDPQEQVDISEKLLIEKKSFGEILSNHWRSTNSIESLKASKEVVVDSDVEDRLRDLGYL